MNPHDDITLPYIKCKYCGYLELKWGTTNQGSPCLITVGNKIHLCKPYKDGKKDA